MVLGFKDLVISFILVGVFVFAFISFGYQFQLDMGANQTLLDDEDSGIREAFHSMNSSLSDIESTANSSMFSVSAEEFDTSGGEITFKTIPKATTNFWTRTTGIFDLLRTFLFKTLGISSTVLGAIATIFTVTLILLGWKLWRTGT